MKKITSLLFIILVRLYYQAYLQKIIKRLKEFLKEKKMLKSQ